ncbi:hypothetical protein [Microbispora bryophytorum]|uniref:hypothetical protein n=1 Tax=Microbispora bryophytorum TaxID=1460882 RepID=UPI001ABEFCD3|nr:hypothetical protein [Microbispora bryophytorum]
MLRDAWVIASVLLSAAAAELGSLAVLLANLATVHLPPVSSLVGPLHGCAYLVVVVAAAGSVG